MRILNEFINTFSGMLREAVQSWYQNMVAGHAIQTALVMMQPKFSPAIEALLIHSIEQGKLDYALHDMLKLYHAATTEEELYRELSRLISFYDFPVSNEVICEGCLKRELRKLLTRAQLEEAYEVILEQDGEYFFHQKYLGIKLVQYKEPCHSKVYHTLRKTFTEQARTSLQLMIGNEAWHVAQEQDETFLLSHEKTQLFVTFM
jgi:hypothetical protein